MRLLGGGTPYIHVLGSRIVHVYIPPWFLGGKGLLPFSRFPRPPLDLPLNQSRFQQLEGCSQALRLRVGTCLQILVIQGEEHALGCHADTQRTSLSHASVLILVMSQELPNRWALLECRISEQLPLTPANDGFRLWSFHDVPLDRVKLGIMLWPVVQMTLDRTSAPDVHVTPGAPFDRPLSSDIRTGGVALMWGM